LLKVNEVPGAITTHIPNLIEKIYE